MFLIELRMPRMLCLSGPKYSSAGASCISATRRAPSPELTIFVADVAAVGHIQEATASAITIPRIRFTRGAFVPVRKLPVACVQTRAADRHDFQTNWPRVLALTEEAAHGGGRLIVLPEGTVPAYVLGDEPVDASQVAAAASDLAHIAKTHGATIVYGGARIVAGRTYNGANVIGPDGSDLGYAAKQFLWRFARRWFA